MNSMRLAERVWNRIKDSNGNMPNSRQLTSIIKREAKVDDEMPEFVMTNAHWRLQERIEFVGRIKKAMETPKDEFDKEDMETDLEFWMKASFEERPK